MFIAEKNIRLQMLLSWQLACVFPMLVSQQPQMLHRRNYKKNSVYTNTDIKGRHAEINLDEVKNPWAIKVWAKMSEIEGVRLWRRVTKGEDIRRRLDKYF
jgi:hypothetical protein